jgi:hypothetical protein
MPADGQMRETGDGGTVLAAGIHYAVVPWCDQTITSSVNNAN